MAETMKACVLAGPQKIVVQDVPVPELKPGELEIEVKARRRNSNGWQLH